MKGKRILWPSTHFEAWRSEISCFRKRNECSKHNRTLRGSGLQKSAMFAVRWVGHCAYTQHATHYQHRAGTRSISLLLEWVLKAWRSECKRWNFDKAKSPHSSQHVCSIFTKLLCAELEGISGFLTQNHICQICFIVFIFWRFAHRHNTENCWVSGQPHKSAGVSRGAWTVRARIDMQEHGNANCRYEWICNPATTNLKITNFTQRSFENLKTRNLLKFQNFQNASSRHRFPRNYCFEPTCVDGTAVLERASCACGFSTRALSRIRRNQCK